MRQPPFPLGILLVECRLALLVVSAIPAKKNHRKRRCHTSVSTFLQQVRVEWDGSLLYTWKQVAICQEDSFVAEVCILVVFEMDLSRLLKF